MNYTPNDEETGQWVILNYFPHNPTDVYGFFNTEEEARAYADKQGMAMGDNAYEVKMVLNAHYQERREPWE
jgi:hypothetical protein